MPRIKAAAANQLFLGDRLGYDDDGYAIYDPDPARLFTPIVIVLGFTVVMVCLDEFVYHRKACTPYEATLHRVIVFGNGAAFLAWPVQISLKQASS